MGAASERVTVVATVKHFTRAAEGALQVGEVRQGAWEKPADRGIWIRLALSHEQDNPTLFRSGS